MRAPIAYLTCELKGRDLDSRFLIAAELQKLGLYAVVGHSWGLKGSAPVAPKGCFLFKTTNTIQAGAMKACRGIGYRVVASDEEAIAQNEANAPMTTDPMAIEHCDAFLTVNEGHKQGLLKKYPQARGKMDVVGSARFDILRAVKTPRPRERPYILVNMVFGLINGSWGDLDTAVDVYCRALNLDLNDPAAKQQVEDRIAYERAALRETEALIDRLLAETAVEIVVRPHPSEEPAYWQRRYGAQPRVIVVGRSDPVPWIQHAAVMVHCDSTTGIEAAILGTPCVNLSPDDAWASRLIISTANYTVRDAEAAVDAIRVSLSGGAIPPAPRPGDDLFPKGAAKKTALAIKRLLPKPARLTEFMWNQIPLTDLQKDKFTVTLDEAKASMERMFALAGARPTALRVLDESVFLVSPP